MMQAAPPTLKVRKMRPDGRLPVRATPGSSGLDLFACLEEQAAIDLSPDPLLVPTGIAIELPPGYEATIRPRSGLSLRGVSVAFGTIDADYRGELLVNMYVFGTRTSYRLPTVTASPNSFFPAWPRYPWRKSRRCPRLLGMPEDTDPPACADPICSCLFTLMASLQDVFLTV